MRMHSKNKHRSFFVSPIKLSTPDRKYFVRCGVRTQRCLSIHSKIRKIIHYPLDGELNYARRLSIDHHLVRPIVSHQAAVVKQAELTSQLHRRRAEIPGRRSHTNRLFAGDLRERLNATTHKIALIRLFQKRIPFVNPTVHTYLMPLLADYVFHALWMELRADCRNEERSGDLEAIQHTQNARKAGARSVFTLSHQRR